MRALMLGGPMHGEFYVVQGRYVSYVEAPPFHMGPLGVPEPITSTFETKTYAIEDFTLNSGGYATRGRRARVGVPTHYTPLEREALVFRTLIAPQYQEAFEKW